MRNDSSPVTRISTIALYFFSACEIGIIFYGNIVQVQLVQAVQTFSHILFDISLGIQLLLNKWHKLFDNQYLLQTCRQLFRSYQEEPGFRRMPIIRAREFLFRILFRIFFFSAFYSAFFFIPHFIPHFF